MQREKKYSSLVMSHRKQKETKQQQGTAGPGNMLRCCLVSFHFLWGIPWPHPVLGRGGDEKNCQHVVSRE